MPRVSIGVPVYNGEDYLAQALEALLGQTYRDFEILISDNASTDGTAAICRDFAGRDPRVRHERNERNLGAAPNYNRTVDLARGEYFKWASHDDLHAPAHLERCVAALDADPGIVLAYPRTTIIGAAGERIADYEDRLDLSWTAPHRRLRGFLRKPAGCNAVFGVMRLDVLRQTGRIRSHESSDYNLLAELCLRGRFHEVPERLFFRRDHPRMSRRASRKRDDIERWFDTRPRRSRRLPFLGVLSQLVRSVVAAPLPPFEKLRCLAELPLAAPTLALRTAAWVRKRSASESAFAAQSGSCSSVTSSK